MTTLSINFHQEQAKMQETFEIHGMVYEFSMDHLADVVALGKELCRWPIHHICEEVDQKPNETIDTLLLAKQEREQQRPTPP